MPRNPSIQSGDIEKEDGVPRVGQCPISVLMPVYNGADFLQEALDSICTQTRGDFEFVIVDDGSTDATATILNEKAARDDRLRVIRNAQNKGIVDALNRGLEACQGTYIVRMDADDIALPDRLEKQVAIMETDASILALGAAVRYMDREGGDLGVIRKSVRPEQPLQGNFLLHPTVVFRRHIVREAGLKYQEQFRYAEDYFLWLQLARLGRIEVMDAVVIRYRTSLKATRMRHLKGVLWSTLKAKWAGVFQLGFCPSWKDVGRFILECGAMLLPSFVASRIYTILMFGHHRTVRL